MKELKKYGRFSFLIPYIIVPIFIVLRWKESATEALLISFFMPLAVESWIVLLYLICWIITIVSFVLCFRESRKNRDREKRKINWILLGIILCWVTIHVFLIINFIRNFKIVF